MPIHRFGMANPPALAATRLADSTSFRVEALLRSAGTRRPIDPNSTPAATSTSIPAAVFEVVAKEPVEPQIGLLAGARRPVPLEPPVKVLWLRRCSAAPLRCPLDGTGTRLARDAGSTATLRWPQRSERIKDPLCSGPGLCHVEGNREQ